MKSPPRAAYPTDMMSVSSAGERFTIPVMDDLNLDIATMTDAEGRVLSEAVATACSEALGGMCIQATYIAESNGFLVQLAVAVCPQVYH